MHTIHEHTATMTRGKPTAGLPQAYPALLVLLVTTVSYCTVLLHPAHSSWLLGAYWQSRLLLLRRALDDHCLPGGINTSNSIPFIASLARYPCMFQLLLIQTNDEVKQVVIIRVWMLCWL